VAWTGTKWRSDTKGARSREFVKQALEALSEGVKASGDPDQIRKAPSLLSAARVKAITTLIETDPCIIADFADFDVGENLVNLANGTLDLQSSVLRPHDPDDLLSKVANVAFDPDAQCPHFDNLLQTTLPKDHQAFVLRLFGYALLGQPIDQVLAIFVGRGANGKSTLLNAVAHTLGDYSTNVEPSSFIKQKSGHIRNDLVRLKGARLVSTSELATGEILDAALVKRFTGGDPITARALYKEHIEFKAEFVVFMTTNSLPVIDGGDAALARRLILIPFNIVLPEAERDNSLAGKLRGETAGILNRVLEGLSDYRRNGLAVPPDLKAAAAEYCSSSDMLATFIADDIVLDDKATLGAQAFYTSYHGWCLQTSIRPLSHPQFRQEMIKTLGISPKKTKLGSIWPGIRRRTSTE
jgi:putative DNA primase/helicase